MDDGEESDTKDASASGSRRKGAYYKNIERKIMLKKKRVNVGDIIWFSTHDSNFVDPQPWENMSYADKWDAINLTLVPFTAEDLEERTEALAEVTDPLYMFSRVEADVEVEERE